MVWNLSPFSHQSWFLLSSLLLSFSPFISSIKYITPITTFISYSNWNMVETALDVEWCPHLVIYTKQKDPILKLPYCRFPSLAEQISQSCINEIVIGCIENHYQFQHFSRYSRFPPASHVLMSEQRINKTWLDAILPLHFTFQNQNQWLAPVINCGFRQEKEINQSTSS